MGGIQFFQYNIRPKDIILNSMSSKDVESLKSEKLRQYEHIYRDCFCKAYDIKCDNRDVESFLYLVNKRILEKHHPEGVDYRPPNARVRLWIAPHHGSIQIGVSSYDPTSDYDWNFKIFSGLVMKDSNKHENLESKLRQK